MNVNEQYKTLLNKVLAEGIETKDRTGVGTLSIFGYQMRFNLMDGFPVIGLRPTPWKSAIAEEIGFQRAYHNANDFKLLGCNFWQANADAWNDSIHSKGNGDIGRAYGVQARDWRDFDSWSGNQSVDQLKNAYDLIRDNPNSRRIFVSHWRPDELEMMALPPCHVSYQFYCDTKNKRMSLHLYMRSNDLILGMPSNITEYAWLLKMTAYAFGYEAYELIYSIGDAHIYTDHIEGARELITRESPSMPTLGCDMKLWDIFEAYKGREHDMFDAIHHDMFSLAGYEPHEQIKFKMAV